MPKHSADEQEFSNAPDPVAQKAAKFAIEVTDNNKKERHPLINKLIIGAIALLVVVGTFGAVTGIINTVQLRDQNSTLKQEQQCQTLLLDTITKEQKARAIIASDDRTAALLLARENAVAKTQAQKEAAYAKYLKQLKINDARRAQFPVPTFENSACQLTREEAKKLGVVPNTPSLTPSKVPSALPSNGGATSTPTKGSNGSQANSASSNAQPGATKAGQGKAPEPRTTTTKTVTRPQPGQSTQPAPAPTPSRVRLLPLPGCTISIIGLNVC